MKDKQRIEVVQGVVAERLTHEEAMRLLGCSERTVFRLKRRLVAEGLDALIHGNRGRASPRRTASAVERRVIAMVRRRYGDINDTHLAEILARDDGIHMGRETLRRLLRKNGIAPKRRRRRPKYRARRERKAAFGMMLQLDASLHDWLEGRGPRMTLVGAIDDATNHRWARFVEAETTWSYLNVMERVLTTRGIPLSVYSDRHTIFVSPRDATIVEQLKGIEPETEFGRAMRELGIQIIPAYSPQAKGRVERLWGVLQDRLVVELRLANARNQNDANAVLEKFLVDFNRRFAVAPRTTTCAFRKPPPLAEIKRILCLKQTRVVQKDHTVSFQGHCFQIPPSRRFHSIAGRRVEVLQLADASLEITCAGLTVARFSQNAVARLVRAKPFAKTELKVA